MPSGAKKRKAAKKKKETHNNNNGGNNGNINNPPGNEDARSQDERDSDGGEASSPLSQDYQPPFIEEPQEAGNGGSKEASVEDNTVIEKEFSENDAESKVYVENVAEEAHGEDNSSSSRSSSSSSSDDESHSRQKEWNEETDSSKLMPSLSISEEKAAATYSDDAPQSFEKVEPLVEPTGNTNTVVEDTPHVEPVNKVEEEHTMESSEVLDTEVLEVVELGVQLNDGKFFPKTDGVSADDDMEQEKNDDKDDGQSLESETSLLIDGSGSKTLASSDLTAKSSLNPETVKDSRTSYDLPVGNKDEELQASNVQTNRNIDVATKVKDLESHESTTEDQPLIAPAPRVAQRTSWMSCCGILDVLTGSGR